MAQSSNYKLKLLYLVKMFSEETDNKHLLTVVDIQNYLSKYNIHADRKTMYADFDALREFGYDIRQVKIGTNYYYYLASRDFELPELKILVDAVQSAKLLTEKRSKELIQKLEHFTSKYQAEKLHRQVKIIGRVKAINENIFNNVDQLNEAISCDSQISFYYYQWTVNKKMKRRKDGKLYIVSPWALMWDDENYYLVGYDAEEEKIKHYRVDKMTGINIIEQKREGKKQFREFNLPKYTRSLFGMFTGEDTLVTLEGRNDMVGTIIDRFGKNVKIEAIDEEHFRAEANVRVSNQFFGWVMSLGEGVKIVGPEEAVERMRLEIKRLIKQYK